MSSIRPSNIPTSVPQCSSPHTVLGRRQRETTLTDLPDEILTKIIQNALQMNPRRPGEISRRVCPRFKTLGSTIALLSPRFNYLLRNSVTALELSSTAPHKWLHSMLIFAKDSLQVLHLSLNGSEDSSSSNLCLKLARTAPPLKTLAISSLAGAPFEHVVAMLRALPSLVECDIQHPRPVDVAAITHACPRLQILSLGPVPHQGEVDEMRHQFVNLIVSPLGRTLKSLNMPWCCATTEAFQGIARCCTSLQRFGGELGVMHWIAHRLLKSRKTLSADLETYHKEQRSLIFAMLHAVGKSKQLQSFGLRTSDYILPSDLELIFSSLKGLEELDLFVGCATNPLLCPDQSFQCLTDSLSKTLQRVNIVGLRFTPQQVNRFSRDFPELQSVSIWMGTKERPPVDVFQSFGKRIKHLSLLCDWNELMCEAVGRHNTNLESLFLAAKHLPLSSISSLLVGTKFTLNEFRLFFNKKSGGDDGHIWNPGNVEDEFGAADRSETSGTVLDAARLVVKDCAANLEVLNISAASGRGKWFVDCTGIAKELGKSAPHLWQICDSYFLE